MIESSANFSTGHVKVMTRAYAKEADQAPNDLALAGVGVAARGARARPSRARLDAADHVRRAHRHPRREGRDPRPGPGRRPGRRPAIARKPRARPPQPGQGRRPRPPARAAGRDPPQRRLRHPARRRARARRRPSSARPCTAAWSSRTSSSRARSASASRAMDRGAIVADIADIQAALDMEDAAGEILGFFRDSLYRNEEAAAVAAALQRRPPRRRRRVRARRWSPSTSRAAWPRSSTSHLGVYSLMLVALHPGHVDRALERRADVEPAPLRRVRHPPGPRRGPGPALPVAHRRRDDHRLRRARSSGRPSGSAVSYYLQSKGHQPRVDAEERLDDRHRRPARPGDARELRHRVRARAWPRPSSARPSPGIGIYKRQTSQLAKEFEA